jgi:hypothetical protein
MVISLVMRRATNTARVRANVRGFGSAALGRRPDAGIKTLRCVAVKCRSPMEAIAQRYWTATPLPRQNAKNI